MITPSTIRIRLCQCEGGVGGAQMFLLGISVPRLILIYSSLIRLHTLSLFIFHIHAQETFFRNYTLILDSRVL